MELLRLGAARMVIDAEVVEALVLGGGLLGGGGGGSPDLGRRLGKLALETGTPTLVGLDALGDDVVLATASLVGAPAAAGAVVTADDFVFAVERLMESAGPIGGLTTSENGATASINGLVQSAALGIPVVDAPCNGRAHPTGIMGSMGLGAVPGYISRQAASGGDAALGHRVRTLVEAHLAGADALIRQAAVEAGGLVAVARNPIDAAYVRRNGAPGALAMAIRLGCMLATSTDAAERVERSAAALGGRVLARGAVERLTLHTRGGYDVGALRIADIELTFWNEYMTAERNGKRLATFPDLIATLDHEGLPVTTAMLAEGQSVTVLAAPRAALILGRGMREPDNFRAVEAATGKEIVRYVFADESGAEG